MMSLTSCFTTDSCTWSWIQQVRKWRFIEIAGRFATNQKAAIDVVRNYCNRSESTGWEIVWHWTSGHGLFGFESAFSELLRSEIPSGICAKLRTVAASNNRDHMPWSLYYCFFAPRTYTVVLHAHPVRGESHNQRNTTGEVATESWLSIVFHPTRIFVTRWFKNEGLFSLLQVFHQINNLWICYVHGNARFGWRVKWN